MLILMCLASCLAFTACELKDPAEPGLLVPLTVDEDPALPFVDVNGTRLHAKSVGNPGDPLLIQLHGGPGGDLSDHQRAEAFAEDGFCVVFFDQRGTGLSRRHGPEVFTLDNYMEDLRQLIAHFRQSPNQKVFLMGHSWGAMYAAGYVDRYPTEIDGLVLSEPGGFTLEDMQAYVARIFAVKPFSEGINDVVWTEQFVAGKSHAELDYEFMLFGATDPNSGNVGRLPSLRGGAVCSDAMFAFAEREGMDFTQNLSSYTTKVLFMYSEWNEAYGREHAELVSSAFPLVELLEIKGTGHDLHYFAFDAYHAASLSYLSELL